MGQMGWIAYLCDTENKKELEKLLASKGFKDPKFAAEEFLNANRQLNEEKSKRKQNGKNDESASTGN